MDKLTAFLMMCHSLALVEAIRNGKGDPAQVLEASMMVKESELDQAVADTGTELSSLAYEFVHFQLYDSVERPDWLSEDYYTREPFYGGEHG